MYLLILERERKEQRERDREKQRQRNITLLFHLLIGWFLYVPCQRDRTHSSGYPNDTLTNFATRPGPQNKNRNLISTAGKAWPHSFYLKGPRI